MAKHKLALKLMFRDFLRVMLYVVGIGIGFLASQIFSPEAVMIAFIVMMVIVLAGVTYSFYLKKAEDDYYKVD